MKMGTSVFPGLELNAKSAVTARGDATNFSELVRGEDRRLWTSGVADVVLNAVKMVQKRQGEGTITHVGVTYTAVKSEKVWRGTDNFCNGDGALEGGLSRAKSSLRVIVG